MNREASEYWARVAAKGGGGSDDPEQKRRQTRQTEMTENAPFPGIDPNETDPLVIITAGLASKRRGREGRDGGGQGHAAGGRGK